MVQFVDKEDQEPSMRPSVDVLFCGDPECSPFGLDNIDEETLETGFTIP